MKIKTQLRLTMVLFGILMLVNAVMLVNNYRQIERLNGQEEVAGNVERAAWELSYLSNDYLLNREAPQRVRWLAKSSELSGYLASLQLNTPDQQVLANQIRDNAGRLHNIFTGVVTTIETETKSQDSAAQLAYIQTSWSRLEVQNQSIVFDASRLTQELFDQEDALRQTNNVLLFVLAVIFGLYLLVNYFIIYRRTLRSIANLQTGAKIIGAGHLSYTIQDRGQDEIGELSRAFNQMTRNLREITASKVDLELEMAERQLAEEALRASESELRASEAELREREATLRQSEARLRRLVEANIIGVITRDAAGRILDANDAFLHMLGYTRADLQDGRLNIFDLLPPEDLIKGNQPSEQAAALEQLAAEQLPTAPEKLAAAPEQLAAPEILAQDERAKEPTSVSEVPTSLPEAPDASANELPAAKEVIAAGGSRQDRAVIRSSGAREKTYLAKDGRRVPVLSGETLVDGPAPIYIGFVLDLSDLKQAQAALADYAEKLKQSNQELEQFAFIASHDLQEPLRKIRGFGETLARRLGSQLEDEPREYLQRMQNAAERMQDMINDLLELSRVGRRGEKFTAVCLPEVIDEVISNLEPRLLADKGQVQVVLGPESVEADPLQMRQLLQNLISNAIKYHRPDAPPVVRVTSRLEPAGPGERPLVTLCVEDNGIGFSEEYLERIFQPFTRLHGRSEYEGTGMGLAICKKIVERHQGAITAHSQPGQGATFLVTLPQKQNK